MNGYFWTDTDILNKQNVRHFKEGGGSTPPTPTRHSIGRYIGSIPFNQDATKLYFNLDPEQDRYKLNTEFVDITPILASASKIGVTLSFPDNYAHDYDRAYATELCYTVETTGYNDGFTTRTYENVWGPIWGNVLHLMNYVDLGNRFTFPILNTQTRFTINGNNVMGARVGNEPEIILALLPSDFGGDGINGISAKFTFAFQNTLNHPIVQTSPFEVYFDFWYE